MTGPHTASTRAGGPADDVHAPEAAYAPAALPIAQPLNALAIDTTSEVLTLAVLKQGAVAGEQSEAIGRRATQEILPRIEALLAAAQLTPDALDLTVVARGPGSFTGTRIGMAVALTVAQVTGRPVVGVDSLRLLAAGTDRAALGDRPFRVLLNCARDEVYSARYRWLPGGLARETPMALRKVATVAAELGEEPVVLRRFLPGVGTRPEVEAVFQGLPCLPEDDGPVGARLLAVGLGRYLTEPALATHGVAPIYLKSEAFRTWQGPA